MKTFDVNIHLADYYFSILNSLSDKAKLYLVNKLTASLINSADKTVLTGRRSNKTRNLIPFDE